MSLPVNLILFRFPSYGPDLSHGVAALTSEGHVVVTDAAFNPGTSVRNAIEIAVPVALRTLGRSEEGTPVYLWTPDDPLHKESLWEVSLDDEIPAWRLVAWRDDPELRTAIAALDRAFGRISQPTVQPDD
jgi:hypothetical protein